MEYAMEKNYDFRKRMHIVHKPGIRDESSVKSFNGIIVDGSWEIVYAKSDDPVLANAAYDFKEFLEVSHGVSVNARECSDISDVLNNPDKRIIAVDFPVSPESAPGFTEPLAYRLIAGRGIIVCANSARGAAQGLYYTEDLMNCNLGPMLSPCDISRKPLFSPRMVHSGYALDVYPDEHLRAIAHAGMDAILVFVKGVNQTAHGHVDFNDLIRRAAAYGIDVYAYSYLKCWKHPGDADAREVFSETFGKIFKEAGFRGIVLVGESVEFPSKDPRTTGKPHRCNAVDNPEGKPSPGWYPCCDYPDWVCLVRDVVREHKPDADIVFWTYNWGYVEEEARIELIKRLPEDISLLVTYEMFEEFKINDKITEQCTDYTLYFEGPGKYFLSEAREAKKRGIRLYTMCNTGGLTWDIGVIPYEPAPFQWKRRYDGLCRAHYEYGLGGLMESHHYGFWPSFVSELAKNAYWEPSFDYHEAARKIAGRDFGGENVGHVIEAWEYFSEGIRHYIPTNEDQYGPFRIGPAYPLLFRNSAVIPSPPWAHFGNNRICNPMYYYDASKNEKLDYEISSLEKMRDFYRKGNLLLEGVLKNTSGRHRTEAGYLLNLGRFIERTAVTAINVKKWYKLKIKLLPGFTEKSIWQGGRPVQKSGKAQGAKPVSRDEAERIIKRMKEVAQDEIRNAYDTMPLVGFDSRLGFEPSMEYMCDQEHIEWKINMTNRAVSELDDYLKDFK